MLHQIPMDEVGPRADAMAKAIQTCVHCGFCLPTCPTYQVLGQESESPRGRILLMKHVLEGSCRQSRLHPTSIAVSAVSHVKRIVLQVYPILNY